jgi:hypothetical protein
MINVTALLMSRDSVFSTVFGVLSKPFPGLVFHVTKMLTNVSAVV